MQQPMENPAMQAEALSRMGRGPDTQLMHVTDSEVNALNGLSGLVFNEPLRTNPETGLPEAGMFKRLLPMIAAAAAVYFTGGAAAGAIGGTTAANAGIGATMAGTGLSAFGGHALGQLAATGDVNFLDAARAGGMAAITGGAMKGFGGAGAETTVAGDFELAGAAAPSFNPATMVDAGTAASASSADAFNAMADASSNASFGGGFGGYEMGGSGQMLADLGSANPLPVTTDSSLLAGELSAGSTGYIPSPMPTPVPMTTGEQFIADVRSPGEVYDYIAADPLKTVGGPILLAGLSGDLDEPLPEAPSEPSRTPFTRKDFTFTRRRRDLDKNGDGNVSQKEIAEVVQGLPEGQSSRFYTPGVFTETAKAGGLLRLQAGGNIQEAIGSLTGGAGASLLPMIAQSVVKPEDEEEESVSKGYPVGVAGTPPGAATTGMAIGGGQPPQPFQTGGALDAAFADANAATAAANAEAAQSNTNAVSTALGVAGLAAGVPGLGIATNALGQLGSYYGQPEQGRHTLEFNPLSLIPFTGVPTIGDQVSSQAATAQANAVNSITEAMITEDEPEAMAVNETNTKSEKAHRAAITEAAEEAEAEAAFSAAMDAINQSMMEETEEDMDVAEAMGGLGSSGLGGFAGFGGIGGPTGLDDTTDDPDGGGGGGGGSDGGFGSGTGPGSGFGDSGFGGIGGEEGSGSGTGTGDSDGGLGGDGSDGSAGDDVKTGGHVGSGVKRLLKLEQGGYLGGVSSRAYGGLLQLAGGGSVPYFEGRVMPTGNMTEDGMSDNIPFVIAGRQEGGQMGMQPAVLSPDEYVIPADVVSSLGNGSSNAGANDLDQFINNFRMDKYGRPNQPPEMRGGLSSLA